MRKKFKSASFPGLFPELALERLSWSATVGASFRLLFDQVVKSVGPSIETAICTGAPRSIARSVMHEPCECPHMRTWFELAMDKAVTADRRLRTSSTSPRQSSRFPSDVAVKEASLIVSPR